MAFVLFGTIYDAISNALDQRFGIFICMINNNIFKEKFVIYFNQYFSHLILTILISFHSVIFLVFPSEGEEDWDVEMDPPDHPIAPPDHSHHLEELGVDDMDEWNNQRQMHYGAVQYSMPEDYAEDFLDADDPSLWEDEFFVS